MAELHDSDTARINHDRIEEIIMEVEDMRDGLDSGELRSAYNGALDRLRVLLSKLNYLHDSHRGFYEEIEHG